MIIEQFYDKLLAHGSYAIISDGKMALVDPARDVQPYLDFAKTHNAEIVAIFETHPHADFVSSHVELHDLTGANIYVSKLVGADYDHVAFDEGDTLEMGDITFRCLHTPGHSPDSISILAEENGKAHAIFTGDTLFVGDVGRPDLREGVGNLTAAKRDLAEAMYNTTREKLLPLEDEVLVYPAHGAGSLCGKNLSDDLFSTMGEEKRSNWALDLNISKDDFIRTLVEGQPFVPKYFEHDVVINKTGPAPMKDAIAAVPRLEPSTALEGGVVIIDTRPQDQFKAGHLEGAINIMLTEVDKFETWLGSIVGPDEPYYLLASDAGQVEQAIYRAAKIGYEGTIKGAMIAPSTNESVSDQFDLNDFKNSPDSYQIIDIRNRTEYEDGAFFDSSVNIPLPELRESVEKVPLNGKPILVHCAGGYRSSAGASIIKAALGDKARVFDLSYAVEEFKESLGV